MSPHALRKRFVVRLRELEVVPLRVACVRRVDAEHENRSRLVGAVDGAPMDRERRAHGDVTHLRQLALRARLVARIELFRREHAVLEFRAVVPLRAGSDLERSHLLDGVHAGEIERERIETAASRRLLRSEERRVGKECRSRWSPYEYKKKK